MIMQSLAIHVFSVMNTQATISDSFFLVTKPNEWTSFPVVGVKLKYYE